MSYDYKVKVKKIGIVNEAGDRVVLITCYIVDFYGVALKAVDNSITFDVRVPKSAPIPSSIATTYLPDLAKAQIAKKYNRYLTATYTPTHGSNKLLFYSTDVDKLFVGLTVTGPGIMNSYTVTYTGNTTISNNIITSMSSVVGLFVGMLITGTNIPSGSTIQYINSSSSITLSQNAIATASSSSFIFSIPSIFTL